MRSAAWFLGGALFLASLEAAVVITYLSVVPYPVGAAEVPAAKVERHMTFRVLAPPGYEDLGYVQLECKPNVAASHLRSGKKIPGPWKVQ